MTYEKILGITVYMLPRKCRIKVPYEKYGILEWLFEETRMQAVLRMNTMRHLGDMEWYSIVGVRTGHVAVMKEESIRKGPNYKRSSFQAMS